MVHLPENTAPIASTARPLSATQIVMLGLIVAAAAFLRFHEIGRASLWMDEIWTIEMSMGHGSLHDHLPLDTIETTSPDLTSLSDAAPVWSVWTHLGGITHPPIYFLTLRLWMDVFGAGPAAVRSLSAIFSLAAVLLFFDVCRFLHNPRVALFAAALMGLAGAQIDFGQEARSYPMVLALSLASADLIIRLQQTGPSWLRWCGLVVLLCATALTHYFAVGILAALAIYVIATFRGGTRRKALGAFAATGVLSLILWGPQFISQVRSLPSFAPTFLLEARPDLHLIYTYRRIVGLPIELIAGELPGELLCAKIPYGVLALAIFVFILPIIRLRKRPDLLLWILWLAGSVGLVGVLDLLHHTTLVGYPRYTFLATPAIYAIIASFDRPDITNRPLLKNLLAAAAILVLAYASADRLGNPQPAKEDWKQFARVLDASAGQNDLLVFYNPDPWVTPGSWMMNYLYYSQSPSHPWLLLAQAPTARMEAKCDSFDSILLVTLHPSANAAALFPQWQPTQLVGSAPVPVIRLERR
jgi:uncharacterized membrane protein